MRVTGGSVRGTQLVVRRGLGTRPTTDRIRQALFNILRDRVQDSAVLDLFAGSGAVGIECLSRGALTCVFVESSESCVRSIVTNLQRTHFGEAAEVVRMDAYEYLRRRRGQPFDLVFADPPYEGDHAVRVLDSLVRHKTLSENGLVVIEHSSRMQDMRAGLGNLIRCDTRVYGDSAVTFYEECGGE